MKFYLHSRKIVLNGVEKFASARCKFFNPQTRNLSAFSLVELLISISIIGMMAALSISAYPRFSEQITVATETYKFLAYIKETQVYGISSYSAPGTKVIYGVEVNRLTGSLKRTAWTNPTGHTNDLYMANKPFTAEEEVILKPAFEIEKICSDDTCTSNFETANIFFRRPNPEGRLIGKIATIITPAPTTSSSLDKIIIHIRSKRNIAFVKKVVILQTGQMYVSDW